MKITGLIIALTLLMTLASGENQPQSSVSESGDSRILSSAASHAGKWVSINTGFSVPVSYPQKESYSPASEGTSIQFIGNLFSYFSMGSYDSLFLADRWDKIAKGYENRTNANKSAPKPPKNGTTDYPTATTLRENPGLGVKIGIQPANGTQANVCGGTDQYCSVEFDSTGDGQPDCCIKDNNPSCAGCLEHCMELCGKRTVGVSTCFMGTNVGPICQCTKSLPSCYRLDIVTTTTMAKNEGGGENSIAYILIFGVALAAIIVGGKMAHKIG